MFIKRFNDIVKRLQKKKVIFIVSCALFGLMPAFYLFVIESFHNYPVYFLSEFLPNRLSVVLFDLILFYILFTAVFFAVKKVWICLVIFDVFIFSFSITNYIKYSLTGENFFPHDIIMAGNMGELVSFVSFKFAWWMWVFFVAAIFLTVILGCLLRDAPFKLYVRLPVSAALFLMVILFFGNGRLAGKVFNKFYMTYESASMQSSNYRENGFTGAFSINIAAFAIQKPEGYSESEFETIMEEYEEIPPSPDYMYPDIIVVLSESFWDPRLLPGTLTSPNPLQNFDELTQRENSYSGRLIVPALGGGTIRTEFEVLTGLSCDALPSGVIPYNIIDKPVPSYVSYYKNLGYDAIAIHPYQARFYNRNICLPRIGFDAYYAEELAEIYDVEPLCRENHGYISDKSFVEYLQYFLNKADAPLFLFGITMENHQSYRYKFDNTKFTVSAYNPSLNESDQHNLEHYVQGIQYADEALGQLCEFIDKRERPTVLVYFGDHLPSICTNYTAFLDTGFVEDTYSNASREKLYATPFMVYSNFELNKDAADFNSVASYDLLNVLGGLIGSGKTQYMGYLDALREVLPYYNSRMEMKDLTEIQKEMLKIQYYATYKAIKD